MEKENNQELIMKFDPNTIEHLGIHQYSTLPPVIAELVSNSYDAEAENVTIHLHDLKDEKEIVIDDNGHGMGFDDINGKFLRIGRNRRKKEENQKSLNNKRYVIGKKGIGKLSFFGIAEIIEVETVQNYIKHSFKMDWNQLKADGDKNKPYKPEILTPIEGIKVEKEKGTTIRLKKIKRKSAFDTLLLAKSLSRAFTIFDEPDFKVNIEHNDDKENIIHVSNSLKYEGIDRFNTWKFPIENNPTNYEYASQINGEIISSVNTLPSSMKGIALFSRGKLVNEHSFYDLKASSFGYDYITGWLNVSFIDDWQKEVISTNRKSLIWEDEDAAKLKNYLASIIPLFFNEDKDKREAETIKVVSEKSGIDIEGWVNSLGRHDSKLAEKIVKSIVKSEGIPIEKRSELIGYVKDSFQFESFKELASEIADIEEIKDDTLFKLLKEWELIEAKEFYKISLVRIDAIKTFEKYINENAKEVPTLHNYLKTFPWLLDPRIIEFDDEVHYSEILKQKFPDSDEPLESDRRIDFLCTSLANSRFVIELKRPWHRLRKKDIEQAQSYRLFVEENAGTDKFSARQVVAYIICGDRNKGNKELEELVEMWEGKDKIYVRTFSELLTNARKYHTEFIDKYKTLEKNITVPKG